MDKDDVWAGVLLHCAADLPTATPTYWVARIDREEWTDGKRRWLMVMEDNGLVVPHRHPLSARVRAERVALMTPGTVGAVVVCDRLPPGSDRHGASGDAPQVTVCELFRFNEHLHTDPNATAPGRDQLTREIMRLYGPATERVELDQEDAGNGPT